MGGDEYEKNGRQFWSMTAHNETTPIINLLIYKWSDGYEFCDELSLIIKSNRFRSKGSPGQKKVDFFVGQVAGGLDTFDT
jgi:hypothetical protein